MSTPPAAAASGLHPLVLSCRQRLLQGREKLKAQHDAGSPGQQVCARWTDLVDGILVDLFQEVLREVGAESHQLALTLVGHGSLGRGDMAPFSDVDVMLLHAPSTTTLATEIARRWSSMVVDTGLQLGFSLRTPSQAWRLAWRDPLILTSLVDCRPLSGSSELLASFLARLLTGASRRRRRLIGVIEQARIDERQRYGEIVYLLQPNVKRSRGGLRDIQLVRWIGFVAFGEADLEPLNKRGLIPEEDFRALRDGYQFLLRLRNQLHLEAGKPQDSLSRPKQVQLATLFGYSGTEGVLPVEQFMQDYFRHTSQIRHASAEFLMLAREESWLAQLLGRSVGWPIAPGLRLGLRYLWATGDWIQRRGQEPAEVLELMAIANRYDRRIDPRTWRQIRAGMRTRQASAAIDRLTADRFMDFMRHTRRLGELLRRLHDLEVLEQIIPAFRPARCLLQFNEYHKYTVDAHCIRAVECATDFEKNSGLIGRVYRSIQDKSIVHLALLIHDLGKGYPEDHSEVGRRIAEQTADRLRLPDSQREMLSLLVHQHLLMTHTAFRLDLSDAATVLQFSAQVGSVEALRHLLVVSCADLAAVGPDVLNDWKLGLISQLYLQAEAHFLDERSDHRHEDEVQLRRQAILAALPGGSDRSWWEQQVAALPAGYLLRTGPAGAIADLSRLQSLGPSQRGIAWAEYQPRAAAMEYSVAAWQGDQPFNVCPRTTGTLSSCGLNILEAEIHTQPGNIAWNRFLVDDPNSPGTPLPDRVESVCQQLTEVLVAAHPKPPVFRRLWRANPAGSESLRTQPTQIRFDNTTSQQYTIVSIFAYDRSGLLYDITQTLFEQQLDLHVAKISTHLDQVVDVFYVADRQGRKLTEPTQLYTLRQRLLQAIESRR